MILDSAGLEIANFFCKKVFREDGEWNAIYAS